MKRTRPIASFAGVILGVVLFSAVAIAQQDASQSQHESHHAAAQVQPLVRRTAVDRVGDGNDGRRRNDGFAHDGSGWNDGHSRNDGW